MLVAIQLIRCSQLWLNLCWSITDSTGVWVSDVYSMYFIFLWFSSSFVFNFKKASVCFRFLGEKVNSFWNQSNCISMKFSFFYLPKHQLKRTCRVEFMNVDFECFKDFDFKHSRNLDVISSGIQLDGTVSSFSFCSKKNTVIARCPYCSQLSLLESSCTNFNVTGNRWALAYASSALVWVLF